MLAQAARRRSHRDTYRRLSRAADQLYLPWLCPAFARGHVSLSLTTCTSSSRSAPQRSRSVAGTPTRALATATAEAINQTKASSVFDKLSPDHMPPARSSQGSLDTTPLLQWKDSRPLIVPSSTLVPPPRLNYFNGIGGDPSELHSNLQACLRVGRLDRAAALLRRMRELYKPTAPELIEANGLYMLQIMERVLVNQPGYSIGTLGAWFENEMRANDIPPNSVAFTCILRATILTVEGPKKERLVRRYLWLAEQAGILESVLTNEAWSDEEYAVLAEVRPDLIGGELPAESEDVPRFRDHLGEAIARPAPTDDFPELRPVHLRGAGLRTVKAALSIFSNREELEKVLPYPHDLHGYTKEEKDLIYARMRQDRLEEDTVDASIERWREEHQNMQKMGITSALQTKPMEALMWQWYTAMVPLFRQELDNIRAAYENENPGDSPEDHLIVGPFLEAFTPEKLAATSLIVTVSAFGSPDHNNGIKVTNIVMNIGRQLATEHSIMVAQSVKTNHAMYKNVSPRRLRTLLRYTKKRDSDPTQQQSEGALDPALTKPLEKAMDEKLASSSKDAADPTKVQPPQETTASDQTQSPESQKEREEIAKGRDHFEGLDWAPIIKAKVGAVCLSKILEATKIPVTREEKETRRQLTSTEPAFQHVTMYVSGRKTGMIQLHDRILEKLRREPLRGSFGTKYPMVVEPLPWTGYKQGGFYRYPEPIIKEKKSDDSQRIYCQTAIEKGDMNQVLTGLSVLGKTAWKVNRDVFKVVVDAWNTGLPIAGIAPENPQMEAPPQPGPGASKKEVAVWILEKRKVENEKSGFHSQRCFQNFQLEVARAFKDEIFYFPHNMDFRGRAYPIPPLLNHLGADLARGLLTFGKGKELGAVGLSWLKIHLANVFGYDKASLSDREAFAMEHLQDIYDSCENPLTGRGWWLQAEDPWQCLATCYELKNALDSPDPSKFVSHLPVHQDGTCNGLQHYAALGGDKAGAAQVNLEPGDKPSDIYSAVAELVKRYVAADAKSGIEFGKILDGKITRKVVKQTVMTNVYGVTFTGARLQVIKQLEDVLSEEERKAGLFAMGGYVAKMIFQALGQMFNGAQDIQDWLGSCANRIATALTPEQIDMLEAQLKADSSENELSSSFRQRKSKKAKRKLTIKDVLAQFRAPVIWTTPLKMPVVQPYRRTTTREITTVLQYLTIVQPQTNDTVDKRKQLQAFPPNFIHSLDATHMLLSALKCNEIGLSFASVHDSFWTHAADIPLMNRVLRDAFVRMHSEDIVGRLHEEFNIRYRDCVYLATVPTMSPLGRRIIAQREAKAAAAREEKKAAGKKKTDKKEAKKADKKAGKKANTKVKRGAKTKGDDADLAAQAEEDVEAPMEEEDADALAEKGETQLKTGQVLIDELLEERARQRLLHSEDEAERARGRAMLTPAALFEAVRGQEIVDVATEDEISVTRLGDTANAQPARSAKPRRSKKDKVAAGKEERDTAADEDKGGKSSSEDLVEDDEDEDDMLAGIMQEDRFPASTQQDAEAVAAAEGENDADVTAKDNETSKKKESRWKAMVKFWMPIDFPDVPKKGDFDVTRLRDSTYFFS